jgi:hypothetical protein
VEPNDRNSRQSSRLRALLDWTKISLVPKQFRQKCLDGWELLQKDFKDPDQYDPLSPDLHRVDVISLVPSAITATLSDENTLFLLELEDQILDSRSISSLSRKMAVQTKTTQLEVSYQVQDFGKHRIRLASSLGIAPQFIRKISSAQNTIECTALEPEMELFAESEIDSLLSSTRDKSKKTPPPQVSESAQMIRLLDVNLFQPPQPSVTKRGDLYHRLLFLLGAVFLPVFLSVILCLLAVLLPSAVIPP